MRIRLKSEKKGNWIGIALLYPNGATEIAVMALMPPDRDWRATMEFYDDLVRIYKKRIKEFL